MSALTQKQIKAREYYQRNKAKICAQKRGKYQAKSNVSPSTKSVFNQTVCPSHSVKALRVARTKVSAEERRAKACRRRIEDYQMARELGVSLNELGAS